MSTIPPEPPNKSMVVVVLTDGSRRIGWRDDNATAYRRQNRDDRWNLDGFTDLMSWGVVLQYASRIYAVAQESIR